MEHLLPGTGASYLLSQLGHDAARAFAARLAPLELTVRQVGILRLLVTSDERLTQVALGERLGAPPSRLVLWIDQLALHGLVERRPNPTDRRSNHLYATRHGQDVFREVERVVAALDRELLGGLTEPEQRELTRLLQKMASARGLIPGRHPAYQDETPEE